MAQKNQLTKADYIPVKELKKLFDCLHKDKKYLWELYARVSFYSALRSSDVLTLCWSDILHRSSFVKTEQKTGKTRSILIPDVAQKHITQLYTLLGCPEPSQCIFYSNRTKKHFTIQYVNQEIKRWKERYNIKVENFSTHSFRKAFGRYVYDSYKDKTQALVLLNSIFKHTSISITKAYIGLQQDEIVEIYNTISF